MPIPDTIRAMGKSPTLSHITNLSLNTSSTIFPKFFLLTLLDEPLDLSAFEEITAELDLSPKPKHEYKFETPVQVFPVEQQIEIIDVKPETIQIVNIENQSVVSHFDQDFPNQSLIDWNELAMDRTLGNGSYGLGKK